MTNIFSININNDNTLFKTVCMYICMYYTLLKQIIYNYLLKLSYIIIILLPIRITNYHTCIHVYNIT